MEKAKATYEDFLRDVSPAQRPDVDQIHALLRGAGCDTRVEPAKSGYVVSFVTPEGKTLANFIFRKKGVVIRVYGDHVGAYESLLSEMPADMQKGIAGASICRRLHDPSKCNARCPMGNIFTLAGETHKKCRYNNFLFLLGPETTPHVEEMLRREWSAREAEKTS